MNTQQKTKFEKRLTFIEYQLQSLQESKEILIKSETQETKALALNEVLRQGYLDQLKILELEMKLADQKKFWIF